MKTDIVLKTTRMLNKMKFKAEKHSPEILVIGGVVGFVVTTVVACKATTKLSGILEKGKEDVEQIHEYVAVEGYSEEYTEADEKKDLTIVYAKTAVGIAKLYAPSAILGTMSIVSVISGHNILRKRNLALAAAYTALDHNFKDYRKRLIEKFGDEVDKELKLGIKAKEIERVGKDEDGNEKTEKAIVSAMDPNDPSTYSEYARFFDDGCKGWTKDPELNLLFLRRQQDAATDLLRSRGYLTLNEVYRMLGMQTTKAGVIVGWVYDKDHPVGDNYVDFGIYDINRPKNRDFVNGYERVILLDFNVDGNIYDLM